MQANAKKKFDETLEAHVVLTSDMRRSDLVCAFILALSLLSKLVVKIDA